MLNVHEAAETSTDTGGLPARRPAETDADDVNVGAFRFWFVGQRWGWPTRRAQWWDPPVITST
jgi:hypothetical protein